MNLLSGCRLYAFVDTACLGGRSPASVAAQLCDGGADIIQVRAKNASLDEVRRMVESVLPVTRASGVPLVVNDHPAIARDTGAQFCHLGQEDFFDAGHARASDVLPASCGLGLSTHSPDDAQRALAAHPAYIAIGPVFATPTKPEARPVTLDYVRWAAQHVTIPWFAIGGINLDTLPAVLEAGARRICVVSALLNAPDIAQACRQFKRRLE